MAADYVNVNRGKQLGNSLVRSADLLRELRELVDKLKDAANHSNDGTDFAVMETNFGLEAGAGANVVTLINILDDTINTDVEKDGVTRLGQIEEYCARLAGQ